MFILSVISFLIIFSLVVFIHEFWHFLLAIKNGVKVEEFAIWLPPLAKKIWENKYWTKFLLNWIPFWWYIKMYWENEKKLIKKEWAFFSLPIFNRMQIVVAWVFMNFLFAWWILTLLFTIWTQPLILSENDFEKYKKQWIIHLEKTTWLRVIKLVENSNAIKYWLLPWDNIIKINWIKVNKENFSSLNKSWENLKYTILRNKKQLELNINTDNNWKIWAYITDEDVIKSIDDISYSLFQSAIISIKECIRISVLTIQTFWDVIVNIFTKWTTPEWVSGPIWIAKMSWLIVKNWTFDEIFKFMALISLSLAVINILPIPVLDWWHLLFLFIEAIMWRKIVDKFRWILNLFGLVFLIWLMVFISLWDLFNLLS